MQGVTAQLYKTRHGYFGTSSGMFMSYKSCKCFYLSLFVAWIDDCFDIVRLRVQPVFKAFFRCSKYKRMCRQCCTLETTTAHSFVLNCSRMPVWHNCIVPKCMKYGWLERILLIATFFFSTYVFVCNSLTTCTMTNVVNAMCAQLSCAAEFIVDNT